MSSLSLMMVAALATTGALAFDDDFERHVRPLLIESCVKCHGEAKQSGGLRLDSREALLEGGDSGPAAVEGNPEASLLIKAVRHEGELRMPPKGRLTDIQVDQLREWIGRGMPWPTTAAPVAPATVAAGAPDSRKEWWSFQPLRPVAPPSVNDSAWCRTEVDRFILSRLEQAGLTPSAPTDRRTLIRRATFDLTGLPPTPEEVAAFEADQRPDAYARLVDRLLESPHYGEQWGRHWLDLVRYADTAGENTDHPVADAWRYRNWVIDAFNHDKPYDEFVREQVAGDLIGAQGDDSAYPGRLVATGFLAIARRFDHDIEKSMHLTYEDAIDTLGKSILGLSIGCARCHDHKHDPISARDYYALYGILQGSKFAFPGCEPKPMPRDLSPMLSPRAQAAWSDRVTREKARLDAEEAGIAEARKALAQRANPSPAQPIAKGEIADGGTQDIHPTDDTAIDVAPGEALTLTIGPMGSHGADSTRIEWTIQDINEPRSWDLSAEALDDFATANPRPDRQGNPGVWCFLDGRESTRLLGEPVRNLQGASGLHVWRNGDTPSVFVNSSAAPIAVWTKLPPASVFAHPAAEGPVTIAWISPVRARVRVSGRVTDAHPGGPDGVTWSLDRRPLDFRAYLTELAALEARSAELARQRADLDRVDTAYAVTEGTPGNARLHLRGDPEKLGPEVPRRWLDLLGGQPVPPDAGSGRLQLAQWLTDRSNPLTARVMANRVWQHHFGKGLVKTPNDFGTRGEHPTHPELLDWLATQFIQDGWSVKSLHRRIMLSSTYQQAARSRPEAMAVDPTNELRWRFDRRRLTAEELRDSLLAASGRLDPAPGAAHPFPPPATWKYTQHQPFATVYETDRRSVYLVTLRNRRPPFFALFDGADPNATTPQRQVTTVPTQALFFMNDPFFHGQAEAVATRLLGLAHDNAERLDSLYRIALQRAPSESERQAAAAFLEAYEQDLAGTPDTERPRALWSAMARAVLASNEFLFVE